MSLQPYIYTMPEQFMEDESVPVKWRLYGLLNGFWIGGKSIYATNEYFAVKLTTSERNVSRALESLEKEGLCTRDIQGFKRYILPGGMTPGVRGGRHGASVQGDMGRQHISDSISDSKSGALEDEPRVVEVPISEEYSGDSKSPRISGDKKKAYDELIAWSENERGFPFPKTTRLKQYRAFKLANENDIPRERLTEMWEELSSEKFWQKAGFDWMNVVQECLKKPL